MVVCHEKKVMQRFLQIVVFFVQYFEMKFPVLAHGASSQTTEVGIFTLENEPGLEMNWTRVRIFGAEQKTLSDHRNDADAAWHLHRMINNKNDFKQPRVIQV